MSEITSSVLFPVNIRQEKNRPYWFLRTEGTQDVGPYNKLIVLEQQSQRRALVAVGIFSSFGYGLILLLSFLFIKRSDMYLNDKSIRRNFVVIVGGIQTAIFVIWMFVVLYTHGEVLGSIIFVILILFLFLPGWIKLTNVKWKSTPGINTLYFYMFRLALIIQIIIVLMWCLYQYSKKFTLKTKREKKHGYKFITELDSVYTQQEMEDLGFEKSQLLSKSHLSHKR